MIGHHCTGNQNVLACALTYTRRAARGRRTKCRLARVLRRSAEGAHGAQPHSACHGRADVHVPTGRDATVAFPTLTRRHLAGCAVEAHRSSCATCVRARVVVPQHSPRWQVGHAVCGMLEQLPALPVLAHTHHASVSKHTLYVATVAIQWVLIDTQPRYWMDTSRATMLRGMQLVVD
jgi:hypothetical protein